MKLLKFIYDVYYMSLSDLLVMCSESGYTVEMVSTLGMNINDDDIHVYRNVIYIKSGNIVLARITEGEKNTINIRKHQKINRTLKHLLDIYARKSFKKHNIKDVIFDKEDNQLLIDLDKSENYQKFRLIKYFVIKGNKLLLKEAKIYNQNISNSYLLKTNARDLEQDHLKINKKIFDENYQDKVKTKTEIVQSFIKYIKNTGFDK